MAGGPVAAAGPVAYAEDPAAQEPRAAAQQEITVSINWMGNSFRFDVAYYATV
jgi:hypothetical protein